MADKPKTIDEYLAGVAADKRRTLEKLRKAIQTIVPNAEECISYGMPAYRLNGALIAGFCAFASHSSYFPYSGRTVEALSAELRNYETSKGTIRFAPDKPLPLALLKKLLRTRIAETDGAASKSKPAATKAKKDSAQPRPTAAEVVATLRRMSKKSVKEGMARFAIPSDKAFGVAVGEMRKYAKALGRNHDLALDLWKTGWYEARMMACFVDDPKQVATAQMERWCKDFDSWAIVDTACFHLFDRTPFAWEKVRAWAGRKPEFEKRAAFALLASLVVHDKKADDELFAESLTLIEKASGDERNFVKKAVNWALRCIGKRSRMLNAAAIALAERLANSENAATRWIAKDALRELKSESVARRLKR